MAEMSQIIGQAGHALLWMWLLLALPGIRRLSGSARGATLGSAFLVFSFTNAGFYSRGLFGDLSLTTELLLVFALLRGFGVHLPVTRAMPRDVAFILVALLLPLYLGALGYLALDLYVLGYEPSWMLLPVAGLLGYTWARQPGLALGLLVGLTAFSLHVLESPNLWDYLADPLLGVAAVFRVVFGARAIPVAATPAKAVPAAPRRLAA